MNSNTNKIKGLFRHNWSSLRAEVSQLMAKQQWAETDFRALSPHENWQGIQTKIRETFCRRLHHIPPQPLWLDLKRETHAIANAHLLQNLLSKLICPHETIWLLLSETVNETEKLWIYEGKINTIQQVLENIGYSEVYLVSKKYEWLLCLNHHDCLIATGGSMPQKLKKFTQIHHSPLK